MTTNLPGGGGVGERTENQCLGGLSSFVSMPPGARKPAPGGRNGGRRGRNDGRPEAFRRDRNGPSAYLSSKARAAMRCALLRGAGRFNCLDDLSKAVTNLSRGSGTPAAPTTYELLNALLTPEIVSSPNGRWSVDGLEPDVDARGP